MSYGMKFNFKRNNSLLPLLEGSVNHEMVNFRNFHKVQRLDRLVYYLREIFPCLGKIK